MKKLPIRVVLVHRNNLVSSCFRLLLEHMNAQAQQQVYEVCGTFRNGCADLTKIEKLKPDFIITDLPRSLEHDKWYLIRYSNTRNYFNFIDVMKVLHPHVNILIVGYDPECIFGHYALTRGAQGYVYENESTELIQEAIEKASRGKKFASPNFQARLKLMGLSNINKLPRYTDLLNDSELEIFWLLGQGHNHAQIREHLEMSGRKLENHLFRIKQKLGAVHVGEIQHLATLAREI